MIGTINNNPSNFCDAISPLSANCVEALSLNIYHTSCISKMRNNRNIPAYIVKEIIVFNE
ncbi:MAG: hypothetical protein R3Y22_00840 [Bacteroidales bacterium]